MTSTSTSTSSSSSWETTNFYLPYSISASAIILTIFLIYRWAWKRAQYWNDRMVPNLSPLPLIGNLKDILLYKRDIFEHFCDVYFNEKTVNEPILGYNILYKPAIIIREPELIRRIFTTDFHLFSNRHSATDPHSDPIGSSTLFFARNSLWRRIRTKMSPIFASGRIKKMLPLIDQIGTNLNDYLLKLDVGESTKTTDTDNNTIIGNEIINGDKIELKDLCTRYTTDVIASCAFGVDVQSIENPQCEFRGIGKRFFEFTIIHALQLFCFVFLPEFTSKFRLRFFAKEIEDFFRKSIRDIIAVRESTGEIRNDLIDSLIQFKNEDITKIDGENIAIKDDILVAQAAIFFQGGFETSASLLSFGLFELAWNQSVQDRLRNEIKAKLLETNGKITFEMINEMEYLQMVISETLRLYPPIPFIDRLCELPEGDGMMKDYSLAPYHNYKITNGMPILLPMYAIQRDPKYFENPLQFDPERFSKEHKHKIHPYAYMPFGHGPRNCIGEKFALLLSKIGFVHFLKNHLVTPADHTPKTIKFQKKAIGICAENGIYLNIIRDDKL